MALTQFEPTAPNKLFAERFVVENEAGRGGMGIVYRAFDRRSERTVALKVLHKSEPSAVRRFAVEAEALAKLEHPDIVRYLAHGVANEGSPYLVIEWLEGESLRDRLAGIAPGDEPPELADVLELGRRIAGALAAAHSIRIVHRDVKPSNILLIGGSLRRPKLLDFGIARMILTERATTSGTVLGTVGYMAPEQARGAEDLDGRADLFSLGCVLFRCLTNRDAFDGPDPATVFSKVLLHTPPRVSELRPGIPHELDELVARLLAKDPSHRPHLASEVQAALARIGARLQDTTLTSELSSPNVRGSLPRPDAAPSKEPSHGLSSRAALATCSVFALASVLAASSTAHHGAGSSPTGPSASSSSSLSPPAGTLITSLPVSKSCRPDAVTYYREGVSALHNATWEHAYAAFEKAAAADPLCAEAQLRYAILSAEFGAIVKAREHYQRATELRGQLSERDRVLYDALAPMIISEPPNPEARLRILEEGLRRFPQDAELLYWASVMAMHVPTPDLERALDFARRATDIDPDYADPWQTQSWALARMGRSADALAAMDACLSVAPSSGDCFEDRVIFLERAGQCEQAISEVRNWLVRVPKSSFAYRHLANELASIAAPEAAVEEAIHQYLDNAADDAPGIARERRSELAQSAAARGDFETAEKLFVEQAGHAKDVAGLAPHLKAAWVLTETLTEIGEPARAAAVSERYFNERVVWTVGHLPRYLVHAEPVLLAALIHVGQLSGERRSTRTELWLRSIPERTTPFETWAILEGPRIGISTDAVAIWQHRPPLSERDKWHEFAFRDFNVGIPDTFAGRVALAAGELDSAISLIEPAIHHCQLLEDPFTNTRAQLWLGDAKERAGDKPGACAAYGVVLQRWGAAKPRSITANEARRRSRALGCDR